jgi:predicted nucleic acid-binding protein
VARYLADTSAWNRSRLVAERWSALLDGNDVAICTPVRLELLYSSRGKRDFADFAWELDGLPHLPLNRRAESIAARTQVALAARSQHRGPKPVDLLVAAIAEVHRATLLHYDRHFDLIARVTGQPSEWLARRGTLD